MVDCDEDVLIAAWLHDTLEDTDLPPKVIEDGFGTKVLEYVEWLSDFGKPGVDGNRRQRKLAYCRKIVNAPDCIKTVKIADLIDNSFSIVQHDRNFARIYLREKAELLGFLLGGDSRLMFTAQAILKAGFVSLEEV